MVPKYDDAAPGGCYLAGMNTSKIGRLCASLALAGIAACATGGEPRSTPEDLVFTEPRVTEHRDGDDLLIELPFTGCMLLALFQHTTNKLHAK